MEILDNGQVQVAFDRARGTFSASTPSGGAVALRSVGPSMQIDGRQISVSDANHLRVTKDKFVDVIGRGEELVIDYQFAGEVPRLRYLVKLYDDHPWIGATAVIAAGRYRLGEVSLAHGRIHMPDSFNSRVYFNTGVAGGGTGVWPLGMRRWNSDTLSSWYSPALRQGVSFGFHSFQRAAGSVISQYESSSEIRAEAVVHYNGYQSQNQEIKTESLLINFGADPLRALEEWVDASVKVVQPAFLDDTYTSVDNTWYAVGDKASESFGLSQARLLRNTPLYGYGVNFFELGEWQKQRNSPGDLGDSLGFGETLVDESLYPHGVAWLCEQYRELGFGCSFGANYAYAGLATSTAAAKPAWLNTGDLAKVDFGYPIDFTHPEARQWLFQLYRTAADIGAKWVWSDFDGGPRQGDLYDPTKVRGFEDIREGIKTIRRAVGAKTLLHRFCCGPYFTYVGLVDRVRTGDDERGIGDWLGFQEVARALASTYMLHRRFWINDPDPLFVGAREFVHNYGADAIAPDPAILDEVHMRMMLQVSTGSFLTLGENLEDYTPESIRLLTQVLPSYGQAARPLDLFVHSTPEILDLNVNTAWERWHVVMLQNWNESDKEYVVHFSDLGLDERKSHLVFRFWDQAFLGEFAAEAALRVKKHSGETYAIRELPTHPWVLGTDMHLTAGAVELKDVEYDPRAGRLHGVALRHTGAQGKLVLYVPAGYVVRHGESPFTEQKQASGATVVTLMLSFTGESCPWSLSFDKYPNSARL